MVGFWFNENETKAFDAALVKANYVKPNGKGNRADYLRDAAIALVARMGTDPKKAKAPQAKAKKPQLAETGKL